MPLRGTALVQGERFMEVRYGERLHLSGELALPRSAGSSSYRDSLARQSIYVLLQRVRVVERLPGAGGAFPARLLYALRGWARGRLEALLPEPAASLLVGILLGSRTSIPPAVEEAFSRSGTTHILAISGWNINIVAAFLAAAGRRLPRHISLLLVLLGIVLYTLFVGASAAVLRAALMGMLYVLAQQAGRPADGRTALFASAWAMTLWNPGLLSDLGFQLSFAATLGMLLFVPVWSALLARWPRFLAESLAATLASQLLTWPVLALAFRQFSLVVPLANLLACPALAPLMLLGALTLLLGAVPGLGVLLRGLTWLVASYMLAVVGWTGSLPWAAVPLPALGVGFLVVYYAVIAWWWRGYQRASNMHSSYSATRVNPSPS
jgi:competence protein ComEC